MKMIKCCVPCLFGLESMVAQELKNIGAEAVQPENGRVFFEGTKETIIDANLWLRTGQRVEIVLGEFPARSFDELFEGVRKLPWEEWIEEDGRFPVKGHALNSKLYSVPDCQAIVKKAIVRRLEGHYKRSIFSERGALFSVRFSIFKDRAVLMLDTSGNALHKRGYRPAAQPAPLRETLAAAMCDLARIYPDTKLFDPFCGSGTILIESALMAKNIAPGLRRFFAAERFDFLDYKIWQEERTRAQDLIRPTVDFEAQGFDIDKNAVELTLANAKKAGVEKYVKASIADVRDFTPPKERCLTITNPPYGERLLDVKAAEELYTVMGQRFIQGDGQKYFVISPHDMFEDFYGKKADKRRKLYNGMIKCQLFMYFKAK